MRTVLVRLLPIVGLAAACAPAGSPRSTPDHLVVPRAWQFQVAEHVALWYHGLAHTGSPIAAVPDGLPLHDSTYVRRIGERKRSAGIAATPLETRAAELGERFVASAAYRHLEFVPLYFHDLAALESGVRVWHGAAGNPARAGGREAATVVALLSDMFPQAAQREQVAAWTALLVAERRAFFAAYWAERAPGLQQLADSAAAVWAELAEPLRPLLSHIGMSGGDVFLVPSLGPEGRLLPRGVARPRIAVAAHGDDDDGFDFAGVESIVYAFLRELVFALASDGVREHVSPARQRELGIETLERNAATRIGALVLALAEPGHVVPYQRYFALAAGQRVPEDPIALERVFLHTFPLPPELEHGIERIVRQALAGI